MDARPTPQAAAPCAIVIFGASGDLTKRKLIPSLYNLASYHLLPADFSIIGVARRPLSDDIFREQLGKALAELGTQPVDPNLWERFQGGARSFRERVQNLWECRILPLCPTRLFRDHRRAFVAVGTAKGREWPLA